MADFFFSSAPFAEYSEPMMAYRWQGLARQMMSSQSPCVVQPQEFTRGWGSRCRIWKWPCAPAVCDSCGNGMSMTAARRRICAFGRFAVCRRFDDELDFRQEYFDDGKL